MSRFLITIISLGTILIIALSFFLYKNTEELKLYKRGNPQVLSNYMRLQKQYDETINKTKNLRQLVVLAKTPDSTNIQIADIINRHAQKIDGEISIYYKNLTTDESVAIDGDKKYYMASLYKVILTLFLLDEVAKGNTTLDAQVGTSSAMLSLALEKIITESNNEYAETLATEYGWKTIERQMKEKLGIEFSFSEELETSVKNIGILFEEIAKAVNIEDSESSYMLRLLKDQAKISKLPKYLPASVYSHNKTGEFENFSHDAGIFYTPKANYILAFMSKTKLHGETNEQMALMSKEIYGSLNGAVF